MWVGDDTHGLGIELLDHLESKLDQVGLAVLAGVVEDGIGGVVKNLVDELVTKSLPHVGRSPEQADGDTALEDGVSAGTNTGTGGDEDHPAEHGHNPQNTIGGETTDPQLGGGVVNDVGRPVTSTGDDERELVPGWLGDTGEGVPFLERRVGDTDGSTGVRAGYNPIMSIP